MKDSLKKSLNSSWIIIKLVIPIYIIADILYYYNILSYISFLFEPLTSLLNLPVESSLAIISGVFLNLYAAVAFAAPIDMTPKEWTILAVFLGVCHSLIVESIIIKKLGISNLYSYLLRFIGGFLIAFSISFIPEEFFNTLVVSNTFEKEHYSSFFSLIYNSSINAIILTIKIIFLITLLIFIMDFVKKFLSNSKKNISKIFSIVIGIFLGITYGAGILLNETKELSKSDIFFIATFLMICHAIIEDTLLFVIFGADFSIVVIVRIVWATLLAYLLTTIYKLRNINGI